LKNEKTAALMNTFIKRKEPQKHT